MKVNPVSSYENINKARNVVKPETNAKKPLEIKDSVQISEEARLLEKSIEKAKNTDIDKTEKLSELKNSIKAGTYKVESGKLADKIISSIVKDKSNG